ICLHDKQSALKHISHRYKKQTPYDFITRCCLKHKNIFCSYIFRFIVISIVLNSEPLSSVVYISINCVSLSMIFIVCRISTFFPCMGSSDFPLNSIVLVEGFHVPSIYMIPVPKLSIQVFLNFFSQLSYDVVLMPSNGIPPKFPVVRDSW